LAFPRFFFLVGIYDLLLKKKIILKKYLLL